MSICGRIATAVPVKKHLTVLGSVISLVGMVLMASLPDDHLAGNILLGVAIVIQVISTWTQLAAFECDVALRCTEHWAWDLCSNQHNSNR